MYVEENIMNELKECKLNVAKMSAEMTIYWS